MSTRAGGGGAEGDEESKERVGRLAMVTEEVAGEEEKWSYGSWIMPVCLSRLFDLELHGRHERGRVVHKLDLGESWLEMRDDLRMKCAGRKWLRQ